MNKNILILTRDRSYGRYLEHLSAHFDPKLKTVVADPAACNFHKWPHGLVVLDQDDGYETLRFQSPDDGAFPCIILSDKADQTCHRKNCRILSKPMDSVAFVQAVSEGLKGRFKTGKQEKPVSAALDTFMVGSSSAMKKIRNHIESVSDTSLPVLIQGETGTGKGVVARTLHGLSSRNGKPYLEINCANVPAQLLESELFGHKIGAFTGAWKDKPGKFELASQGTVFLDEISEMSFHMQAKLLQVLQEGEFSPVGSTEDILVDIRVIAATNAELENLIARSLFRSDLFYRLAVISLVMPPLRERPEDIELLSTYFLEKYSSLYAKKSRRLSEKMKKMQACYLWPGNVRELENMIKTIVVMENEDMVLEELQQKLDKNGLEVLFPLGAASEQDSGGFSLKQATDRAVQHAEKQVIAKAISRTRGNKKQAAQLLQVSYKSLLNKTKMYEL